MKKTILLFSSLPIAFVSCNNRNTDKQIINNQITNDKNMQVTEEQKAVFLQAIGLYIEAGRKGDSKIARRAGFLYCISLLWARIANPRDRTDRNIRAIGFFTTNVYLEYKTFATAKLSAEHETHLLQMCC